jgi:hypothetical protein
MQRLFRAVLMVIVIGSSSCWATEVGYKFSGSVTFVSSQSPPYGLSIQSGAAVSGKFIYDPASPASHDLADCGGDCTGYRQSIVNGFSATIGAHTIRADDFIIAVFNDVPDPFQGTADILAIRHYSNLDPPLPTPLYVNGVARAENRFNISLNANASLYNDSSLPPSIDPADFPVTGRGGTLSDTATGVTDLFFSVTTLQPFIVLTGDYNIDESVDEADYELWRQSFGSSVALAADGNRDARVSAEDYVLWRKSATTGHTASAFVGIPEPNSFLMLAIYWYCGGFDLRCTSRRHR